MSRILGSSIVLFSFVLSANSQASTLENIKSQLQSQPYMMEKIEGNDDIFNQYCIGDANSADIPQPRYSNALVQSAAKKLTATKDAANARLQEMAQENFLSSLNEIKSQLNEIIASTTDKTVLANAQILLAEVNQPNITSISSKGSQAYKAMTDVVLVQLKKDVAAITPKLTAELKGIDLKVFTKLAQEMNKYAAQEIKGADYNKMASLFTQLYPKIKAAAKPLDYALLKQTFQAIIALPDATGEAKEMLDYAKSYAQRAVEMLKNGTPNQDDASSISYYISDSQYYLNEVVNNQDYKADGVDAIIQTLAAEENKNTFIYLAQSADELNTLLQDIEKNKQEISYALESVSYSLDSNIKEGTVKIFDAASTKIANSFIAEVKNTQSEGILDNIKSIISNLALKTDEGNNSAYSFADSVMYSLEQMPNLSKGFLQTIASMKSELTKQQTQYIIDNITKANNDLKNATEFNNDVFYSLNDLNYYLQQGVVVSAATQKLVDAFKATMTNSQSIANISSYMSAVVSEGKQADHFYFYGGVRRLYKLSATVPQVAANAGANKEAHWFLVQLCGEFRDRATMIEAKLKWVNNINILAKGQEAVIEPETLAQAKNVWMRITAKAYYPYISVAASVWEARRSSQDRYITIGGISDIDNPVAGLTVCETKYVMAEYVAKDRSFDNITSYDQGYESYKQACPTADLTDYYDFRGDSNFKHYSPESNGMIWYATSLAGGCTSATKADGGAFTNQDCENYFKNPFAYRYNAARAGLAAWLFRDDKHANVFSSQGQMVAIYPHTQPQYAPFSFGFSQTSTDGALFDYNPEWLAVPNAWNTSDIGFNGFTGLGTNSADQERAYVLLRDAVDRHTDWYSSGYNDGNGVSKDQAYSPFVASSYVMQSSDGFTQCGTTVQCPDDGLKRWMFVFRIKGQNWYTPARIANDEPLDFDKMWFDETSFGVSGLADSEHAWDRLGTAQEEEFDSILYLVNVGYDYGDSEGEFDEGMEEGLEYDESVEEP